MLESHDRSARFDFAARQLAENGFFSQPGFLAPSVVAQLRHEVLEGFEEGTLQAARVGAGSERVLAPAIRRDWIHWLDPNELTAAQRLVANELEQLRVAINQQTFMGLFEWEGHLALYHRGAFYKRHVDVFRTNQERKVTFIYYLNPDWVEGDGGELRVYANEQSVDEYFDVQPRGGTLVLFFSERVPHEVLESRADRATLTGWFRVRN